MRFEEGEVSILYLPTNCIFLINKKGRSWVIFSVMQPEPNVLQLRMIRDNLLGVPSCQNLMSVIRFGSRRIW
ncbi:hypothetical protein IA64_17185 [Xanthomonas arboricola pv. celebensis]|nr:hypothetical protein IA64_17185 [Xanthomonas arboricola pv. celebensis]